MFNWLHDQVSMAEFFSYILWCKLRGKPYTIGPKAVESGKCYLVIRELPDDYLIAFGRYFQFWVPIVFERIELKCPGTGNGARVFHRQDQCEQCGLDLKTIKMKTKKETGN